MTRNWTEKAKKKQTSIMKAAWKKRKLEGLVQLARDWSKPKTVKVLIQEFMGSRLVAPNKHNSKCLLLYNTEPKEVFEVVLKSLRKDGLLPK